MEKGKPRSFFEKVPAGGVKGGAEKRTGRGKLWHLTKDRNCNARKGEKRPRRRERPKKKRGEIIAKVSYGIERKAKSECSALWGPGEPSVKGGRGEKGSPER